MRVIYIGDNYLKFTDDPSRHLPDSELITLGGEGLGTTNLLENLQNNKSVTVLSASFENIFENLRRSLGFIEAAGGLVRDGQGRVLMIYRNGRWDLPKGHCEAGEKSGVCALREVEEECGVGGLKLGKFLTETFHSYIYEGRRVFKATKWYAMTYPGLGGATSPQTEEGIECAEWLDAEEVRKLLPDTFPTIREVFEAASNTL